MIGPELTGGSRSVERPQTRSITAILGWTRRLVEPAHRAVIDGLPPSLARVACYHVGWSDADGHPIRYCGKSIRPALALLSERAAGGDAGAAVQVAVATELVHDFSLLHDDVMDGDRIRRHRPAAWTVFGTGTSVLPGDGLLALAWDIATSEATPVSAPAVLARTLLDLCGGQAADLAFERRVDVTVADALVLAEQKTGVLLGAACELGALSAGADAVAALAFQRFGRQLGVVFQLVDDLLGIWGGPQATGKPVGADLAARKNSLPVVAALTSGTAAGDRLKRFYRGTERLDPDGVRRAAELVEQAGGRDWTRAEVDRRLQRALDLLASIGAVDKGGRRICGCWLGM